MVAILLTAFLGFAALAVDVGSYRFDQRVQQAATDSAAIAGTSEVNYGASSSIAAAKADAASNGMVDGANGVTISIDPAYSDSYTGSSQAVLVKITKSYPRFFSVLMGGANVAVTTTAVAKMDANDPYCLYQLDPNASPNFNGMTFNGPHCGIILNGTGNFNGATIDASVIGYSGSAPNETGATFEEAKPSPALPVSDPCSRIPGCAYLSSNPPSTASCPSAGYNGQTVTLYPGCLGNTNFNGATVTFSPGTYALNGSMNFNGATLNGTGVTFYITKNAGGLNFNGARLNLTPPTSGNEDGVLMYQVPSDTSGPNFNGAVSATVSGLLYFPTATINFNGSLGAYTVMVAASANFNGSTQAFPSPPPNASLAQQATLAE